MTSVRERELLQRARRFDEKTLTEIYDRWSPMIYRYAIRLLGAADLAEDCVSETFSRFLTALQHGTGPEDYLQAYLYRIAHNWITDHYRRTGPPVLPLMDDHPAARENEPAHLVADELERQQIRAALSYLTPDQRQVIMLKYLENCDNQEIALALGKPVGAIKALQHRALAALRQILSSLEERP